MRLNQAAILLWFGPGCPIDRNGEKQEQGKLFHDRPNGLCKGYEACRNAFAEVTQPDVLITGMDITVRIGYANCDRWHTPRGNKRAMGFGTRLSYASLWDPHRWPARP